MSDDFLNPKSMLTPGIAGGITMLITGTLWCQFGLPQKWSALFISFMLGAIIFKGSHYKSMPKWQIVIFYMLNSLIIFSVGTGANKLGYDVSTKYSLFPSIGISEVYAGDLDSGTRTETDGTTMSDRIDPPEHSYEGIIGANESSTDVPNESSTDMPNESSTEYGYDKKKRRVFDLW
jgi:hypothetical protein